MATSIAIGTSFYFNRNNQGGSGSSTPSCAVSDLGVLLTDAGVQVGDNCVPVGMLDFSNPANSGWIAAVSYF